MTNTTERASARPVAVGFDGTARSIAALEYAAGEAARRKVPLRVIHVSAHYGASILERESVALEVDASRRGAEIAVQHHVRGVAPRLRFEVRFCEGPTARALLEESEDAQLVVLGRESKGAIERAVTGATTAAVASRAGVPTIVVPSEWAGELRLQRVLVVGLKGRGYADALLDAAFECASRSGAELRILHAGDHEGDSGGEADSASERTFSTMITSWRRAHPEVRVRMEMHYEDPAAALIRASESADLVLMLRRTSDLLPAHLGRVARAVVQHAACPVELIPAVSTMAPLELEEGGALLR